MQKVVLFAEYFEDIKRISNHYHDCHELMYIKKGDVDFKIGKKTYHAHPGSLIIINRFEEHSTEILSRDYWRVSLRIAPTIDPMADSDLPYLYQIIVNRPENFSHLIEIKNNTFEIENILMGICNEMKRSDSYSENMSNLLFKQLLIWVSRNSHVQSFAQNDKNTDLVNNIKRLFETEYMNEYKLNDVAVKYHISPYYMSHIFKEVTGCSVMNYLTFCRIAQAKKMLIKTDMQISEIVAQCGFSDNSNFGRLFKKSTGISAKAFRNKYKI